MKYKIMLCNGGSESCIDEFDSELDAYGLLEQLQDNDPKAIIYIKAVKV